MVCLAFPLHPPGRPDKSRLPELLTPSVPVQVVQGERDAFGGAALVQEQTSAADNVAVTAVPGADHSMRVAKGADPGPAGVRQLIIDAVAAFCRR